LELQILSWITGLTAHLENMKQLGVEAIEE
jgi:hypothetical protein